MGKRIAYGLTIGGILGGLCIFGATLRSSESLEGWYLFAFWFNRFLMGFVFAFLPALNSLFIKSVRGVLVGLIVSFAFYSATNYHDVIGFLVGGLYGVIIELAFYFIFKEKANVA